MEGRGGLSERGFLIVDLHIMNDERTAMQSFPILYISLFKGAKDVHN